MDSQIAEPDDNAVAGRAAIAWMSVRVILFGIGGIGSGLLSCRVMTLGNLQGNLWIWVSAPGLVYGLFWLLAAWIPGALSVRDRVRRSVIWTLAFLAGIMLSYVGAYYTAFYLVTYLDDSGVWEFGLGISGFLAGIPGSLGLVCCWSFLFPAADSWFAKAAITALGAMLGSLLYFWDLNEPDFGTLYLFFAIWQGGMAGMFSAIDSARRMIQMKESES